MKTVMRIITGIFIAMAVLGACCIDTEGTFVPYIITVIGMAGAVLLLGFYWRVLQ